MPIPPQDPMEAGYGAVLASLDEDPARDGLARTPARAAEAMRFMTRGYARSIEELAAGAMFESDTEDMVICRDIELYSLCEHHLLPFIGRVHVGYLPRGRVIGLSRIADIVELYARRLQVQERLTSQIATAMQEITGGHGVGVVLEARHLCVMMRGVQKQNSSMTTSSMLGTFRSDLNTRNEFLSLLRAPAP